MVDGENALDTINSDVNEATRGTIPRLLYEFDQDIALVLINAIYFKGDWKKPFKEEWTKLDGQFRTTSGAVVNTALMTDTRRVPYYEHSDSKAVLLDYSEGNLAMVFILPPEDVPLHAYIRSHLTAEFLRSILYNHERKQRVYLTIPRFRVESPKIELIPFLLSLGISDIFTRGKANLSKISSSHELWVGDMLQKAVIECNENGTKAVAVTAFAVLDCVVSNPPAKEFTANRPFLFALATKESFPRIIFTGAIEDPSRG